MEEIACFPKTMHSEEYSITFICRKVLRILRTGLDYFRVSLASYSHNPILGDEFREAMAMHETRNLSFTGFLATYM
jgi:hypothetical protein